MNSDGRFLFTLESENFHNVIESLQKAGYRVLGPTLRDRAVIYDEVDSVDDLPAGWGDSQEAGTYRLAERSDEALFGYTSGPQSWKRFLHPPEVRLVTALREDGGFRMGEEEDAPAPMAFVGVRACELAAIAIQDRVFLEGPYIDPIYRARREKLFIVAVNCGQAGGTCFCASLGTGPRARSGYDLALTEILEADRHYFVGEVGSEQGERFLEQLPYRPASEQEIEAAYQVTDAAARQMGRTIDPERVKEILYDNYENPRWEAVANRCLACGNCTMVCPTCFCTTVQDVTDLTGDQAERHRVWDSCFTMDFSYIHGGSVRYSTKARYRQWLTHKMATWVDQFGVMGCVGCGRCITWCPVGIDITAEVRAIRETKMEGAAHEDAGEPAG